MVSFLDGFYFWLPLIRGWIVISPAVMEYLTRL